MVMPAVRPRSNGEPLTEAPRTPVVALIGKTLTLVPAPLPSTAIRNLGVVGNAPTDGDRLSAEHETRTNASSTLAGALNGILVFILFSSKYTPPRLLAAVRICLLEVRREESLQQHAQCN